MPKLKYDADWSEETEVAIGETLSLTEEQETKLFTDHGTIVITKEQAELLEAMNDEQTNDDDSGGGDDDRNTPDTEHPDADVIDISVAAERDRDAIDVGKALSDKTLTAIREGYEAREKVNITSLLVMTSTRADMKAKKKDMGDLPIPNSYRKGGLTVIGKGEEATPVVAGDNARNAPWDKYTYQDVNDNGKQVTRKASYFGKMFEASPLGVDLKKQDESLTTALNSAAFKKDGGPMPADWQGKSKPQLVRRRNLVRSRFNFGVTTLKKAVSLDKQCRAFDGLTLVGYSFEQENNEYVNRNEPIQVYSIKTVTLENGKERQVSGEPSNVSIGAFLRYNVAEAIAKAGKAELVTLEHLQATVKREKGAGKDKTKTGADDWSKHEIENVRQLENIFSSLTNYLTASDGDVNSKRLAAIEKRIDEKDGAEFLIVMGDFSMALDDVWTKYAERYRKLSAERRKQAA